MRRALLVLAVASGLAAGCGGAQQQRRPPGPAPDHAREVERNPYALTCEDLARQPENSVAQRMVIHAEFALAEAPALRRRMSEMTANRTGRSVYWALTEICKGRDPAFRPARAAVEAVRHGRYLVQPRPDSWSDPERWEPTR